MRLNKLTIPRWRHPLFSLSSLCSRALCSPLARRQLRAIWLLPSLDSIRQPSLSEPFFVRPWRHDMTLTMYIYSCKSFGCAYTLCQNSLNFSYIPIKRFCTLYKPLLSANSTILGFPTAIHLEQVSVYMYMYWLFQDLLWVFNVNRDSSSALLVRWVAVIPFQRSTRTVSLVLLLIYCSSLVLLLF